ncbi:alpha/beta superfamily transporter hydrolase [Legionella birminghamensis]|uniref:Alpha/beta superfamily transporter hydrolase n=1 Tax=Legionella birminghamensis TaxID=28083 RepID=A0A378I6K2_9GAMM|nr:alpha/beta hydrolase [Legionella birminghamensis]KTC70202.1 alpha/beta superfamily transporter hydrolase [Legionella birminghamensis]STX30390.1 transmembrane protein [Legionella birminghamensis]
MIPVDKLTTAGEHPFFFEGEAGSLEAVLTVPAECKTHYIALLGHPHSLQGGTMNNKVVTTIARAFKERGIPSIRFNFRGVGQSMGTYDAGIGESEDMLKLARLWHEVKPEAEIILAGFSFGSFVAYRTAAHCPHRLLISVAPPVHHYDYSLFTPSDWTIFQGDEDDVVPLALVVEFAAEHPGIELIRFADTGHFFHGKLLELKAALAHLLISREIGYESA